jgi:hypothetical protein
MDTLQGSKNHILVVLLMALFGLICCASSAQADWTISTIDSEGYMGEYSSIAIDSNNKVHISYIDYTNWDLKYATNASGSCVTSTIDSEGYMGEYSSIAIDSNNKVHISYIDSASNKRDLRYATNISGSWVTSTIVSEGWAAHSSIAIDSNNKVHISYEDWSSNDLKYTTNASGSWVTSTIDSEGNVGYYTSIAIDSNNKVHISYRDGTNKDLKYATNSSGSWVTSTIDSEVYDVEYTSIAIDSNNKVHISYYEYACDLKYATNASGSWVTSRILHSDDVCWGEYSSIAIDSNNKVHISHHQDEPDGTYYALKYATNASGSWVMSTIDSGGDVGAYTSIAIDSNNKVHISYFDQTNADLKYATNACAPPGGAPTLLSPSNGATDVSSTPLLSWSDVAEATSYTVQVCGNSNCSNIIASASVASSPWTVSSSLNPVTQYWWRVNAGDSCGAGPWSSIWSFSTSLITYTLNVNINPSDGGTVAGTGITCPGSCSNAYGSGTSVTLTANANSGFAFYGWSGCNVATENTCYVTLDTDKTVTASYTPPCSPVYRFWSNTYMHHFFTISEADKNYVIATWPDIWTYEGPVFCAFTTQAPGTLPIYRFWSTVYMGHFYTISEADKNYVIATWPDVWTYEGIVWYAYPQQVPGTLPIYRFWSDVYMGHFYTISEADKNLVIANWPDVWTYEGPVYYAFTPQ